MTSHRPDLPLAGTTELAGQVSNHSEERLRILSELAQGYSYSLTRVQPDCFRVDWVTPDLERVFRVRVGDRLDLSLLDQFIPTDERARVRQWLESLRMGAGPPLEHRVLDVRGKTRWIHHSVHAVLADGILHVDGGALDITERKQVQRALAQSEERFRMMADQMSNLILELNSSGSICFANPAVREILGWDPKLVTGVRVGPGGEGRSWIHRDDLDSASQKYHESMAKPGLRDKNRTRFMHRDGRWRWVELAGNSYLGEDGLHTLLVGRDVTDVVEREEAVRSDAARLADEVEQRTQALRDTYKQLRELRSRLADAEKLGAAEELAGSLAHAINNPLSALIGRVQMQLELPVPSRQGVLPIQRLAQRIHSVVTHTLALYREGRLRLQDTEAWQLIDDLRAELGARADRSGVVIEVRIDDEIPALWVDRTLLAAALVSIAENGIDAMPKGGVLEVEVRHLARASVVQFRIADAGAGIDAAAQERIFEAFFTTKSAGTGLGLPIANGVVRGHRGRIDVEARPTGGTLFCVSIPYGELRADQLHASERS